MVVQQLMLGVGSPVVPLPIKLCSCRKDRHEQENEVSIKRVKKLG